MFDDKAHIIYVNGEIKDDTPLGKLMQDLSCTNPDDMNYKELADRARYFKRDKEGQQVYLAIRIHDKAVMLILGNINSNVNHKKSPLKSI